MQKDHIDDWLQTFEAALTTMRSIDEDASKKFIVRAVTDLHQNIGSDCEKIISEISNVRARTLAEKTLEVCNNSTAYHEAYWLKRADTFTDRILFMLWEAVRGDLQALEIILLQPTFESKVGEKQTTTAEQILRRMRHPNFIQKQREWVSSNKRVEVSSHPKSVKFIGPAVFGLFICLLLLQWC